MSPTWLRRLVQKILLYADDVDSTSTSSDSSVASAATLLTFTTETSEALFKPLADAATLQSIAESTIGKKAVKADDAEVPTHLWDDYVQSDIGDKAKSAWLLEFCRKQELSMFRRTLYLDCLEYLEESYGSNWQSLDQKKGRYRLTKVGRDRDAIRNILWHANETSFFEYHAGSRLHFFQWPKKYRKMARDGVPVMFEKPGPMKPQRQPQFEDPDVKAQICSKILKVINRRYMVRARTKFDIKSLIKYFAVPKGLSDVRIVYNATASGLNESVWAPSFWLPTIDSLVRSLDSSSWMADRDIGDMFLNFQLQELAWSYAGVDIQPIMTSDEISAKKARWYHWVQNAMGFAPSPYNLIKMALIAEEVIRGNRTDPSNPFHWEKVRLNLPGSAAYEPTISWICKIRADGLVACELFTFVDDEREGEAVRGGLADTEMFLSTDNSTAESAFYKGSSSSKKLHGLILRLHQLALDFSIILHVIHLAGTRMIAQGTNGCSRGVLMEGVMAGQSMLSFIDLDKLATEHSAALLGWIQSWCGKRDITPLTPEEQGKDINVYVLANVYKVDLLFPAMVVVSGSAKFYDHLRVRLNLYDHVMSICQQSFRGVPFKGWHKTIAACKKRCKQWQLSPILFFHNAYGGATNAAHLIRFTESFGLTSSEFDHPPNVARTLRHFWKPSDPSPVKFCLQPPEVQINYNIPLYLYWQGHLRLEGLLPVSTPNCDVCGPSVFHPGLLMRRKLTKEELLAVYDVPSVLCPVFQELGNWCQADNEALPFEDAPSPVIILSLFCQLWSSGGGRGSRLCQVNMSLPISLRLMLPQLMGLLRLEFCLLFWSQVTLWEILLRTSSHLQCFKMSVHPTRSIIRSSYIIQGFGQCH
jgi:hypothetical protein